MKNLDWISAGLLLAGVILLRYHIAEGWILCALSSVAAIWLFLASTYQDRPLYGKVAQATVMMVLNLSNYAAWRGE